MGSEKMHVPENKIQMIKILLIAVFGVILYALLSNLSHVIVGVKSFLTLLSPVFWGILIAFVVNLPMRFLEEHLCFKIWKKQSKAAVRMKRPVCLIVSYLLWSLLAIGVVIILLPEFISGLQRLGRYLPNMFGTAQTTAIQWIAQLELAPEIEQAILDFFQKLFALLKDSLSVLLPWLLDFTKSLTNGVTGLFIGFIISFYILFRKEKWLLAFRKILYAFASEQKADRIASMLQQLNENFSSFAAGQVIESLIIGVLCFVGMSIFRFDFALLTSTTVAFFSLIPLFGTYIGAIPGALLLLMVDPIEAFWFMVFIVILKSLEGYLIYPRVVGHQIGLSGMWVLLAVVIGAGVGGFVGCLISVPVFATVYSLLSDIVEKRIHNKISDSLIRVYPVK